MKRLRSPDIDSGCPSGIGQAIRNKASLNQIPTDVSITESGISSPFSRSQSFFAP